MKNEMYVLENKEKRSGTATFKAMILVLLMYVLHTGINAQPNIGLFSRVIEPESIKEQKQKEIQAQRVPWRFGTGMETYNTKDLHGTYYSAHLCMIRKRTSITLGPVMQKRTSEIQGVKLGLSVAVKSDDAALYPDGQEPDMLQLKFFAFAQYVDHSKLSYKAARVETLTNLERNTDFSNMRLSTATVGTGCELDINFKYICVRTYAGLSVFHHFNFDRSLFHEETCAGLVFGVGVCLHK
jgi:hypothetical protein